MNNYFSYLDTIFRIINLNFDSNLTKESILYYNKQLNLYDDSDKTKALIIDKIKKMVFKHDYQIPHLLNHEYCHFLQTFYYPYVYISSYLQFRDLFILPHQFSSSKKEIPIDEVSFIPKINYNFTCFNDQIIFFWNENELMVTTENESENIPNTKSFCLNDFIENAASIYQFQSVFDSENDSEKYFEWVNNPINKGYKNIYIFLSKKVGKIAAYNMIRKITQIMFRTTDPIPVFRFLVNYWIENHPKETDLDYEYLETIIKQSINNLSPSFNIDDIKSIGDLPELALIGYDQFMAILSQTRSYPISYLAEYLIKKYNVFGEYKNYIIDVNQKKFFELFFEKFVPIVQYYIRDFGYNSKPIIELYNPYESIKVDINNEKSDENFYWLLIESMKVVNISFEIINRKGDNTIPMYCLLRNCPYYNLKLCRRWHCLPKKYEDCTFPLFFQIFFNRKIDIENRTLIYQQNNDVIISEYNKKYEKYRRNISVNFQIQKDRIILFVPREELNISGKSYFLDFIKILTIDKNISLDNLLGKIYIQFMGFEDDKRNVYEISEIRMWMSKLKDDIPELFYYLNWEYNPQYSPPKLQPSALLPIYLEYEKTEKDNVIKITSDITDFLINKQLDSLKEFCSKNNLSYEYIIEKYSKTIIKSLNYGIENYN